MGDKAKAKKGLGTPGICGLVETAGTKNFLALA
jgi:hypothetical protein